ncbi:MAG: DNA polymerase III subunit epsilon [Azoarcus sp.]|jgi:DNA polymerase-3 subunit epsilon|nr:DNA polymerase III subunit epsilon [Azoarcus sp.]
MRQIVLDTETTGLDWKNGDRVIEIGCVELRNRVLTGGRYHVYINPGRAVSAEAQAVHGIDDEFLADKCVFAAIAQEFEDFVRGAQLVIHNAMFDVGFLVNELRLAGRPAIKELNSGNVIDTLALAREQNPGKKASLDALCERFGISNAHRTLHGALLDAELLAEVYLAMTRGQESLMMALEEEPGPDTGTSLALGTERPLLKVLRASSEELAAHDAVLADIEKANKGGCLWLPERETVTGAADVDI